ncbi:hypothetical protein BJ170DRAFT_132293 [Xylariales sp. AK1849]|nr:hypothetical protein BJ170DRAFT_132293 [Xylariales sp. AK1849]
MAMKAAVHHYDAETGQVFRERVVKHSSVSDGDWHTKRPFGSTTGRGQEGPRSLVETAIQVVGDNFGLVEDNALQYLPDHLVWMIWDYLTSPSKALNFQAWKMFASYSSRVELPQGRVPLKLFKHCQELRQPSGPLTSYTNPMMSTTFEFISHLTIADGASFEVSELLKLPEMKNLGVLEIVQPQDPSKAAIFPRVSDRVVREWSQTPGAFPCLRVLRIWGDNFTTSRSLEYAARLPALAIYDVAGRYEDWRSRDCVHPQWERRAELWGGLVENALRATLASLITVSTSHHQEQNVDIVRSSFFEEYDLAMKDLEKQVNHIPVDQVQKSIGSLVLRPGYQEDRRNAGHWLTFDVWGYGLFSQIGKLWSDRDLRAEGVAIDSMFAIGNHFIAPSRPFASICLGNLDRFNVRNRSHSPRETLNRLDRYWTFIRGDPFSPPTLNSKLGAASDKTTSAVPRKRQAESNGGPALTRRKKAIGINDMLSQFST